MPRLFLFSLGWAVALAFFSVSGSQAACGSTEQDRIVWARERMHPSASSSQIELVYQWLANGTRSCSQSGDLWYFRSLVEKKLGKMRDAQYSFGKAEENGSKARAEGLDPFATVTRPASSGKGQLRDKWALIVGVSTFEKSDDFLEFSGKDAKDLGSFLVQNGNFKGDHVKILVDKQATSGSIREAFGEIRTRAKADDLVLVYFSSHGQPRDLDPTGLSYVLTYDTDASSAARLYATGLQMVELAELGRWVLSRDYVLLLDTCFSGAAKAGVTGKIVPAGSDGLDPLQGLQGSGARVVISASRADERSYEDPESKHGYFTRFLIEALRQDGGQQGLSTVYQYLQERVATEVGRQDGRKQHPVMEAFGDGKSIVLSAPLLSGSHPAGLRMSGLLASAVNPTVWP
ncbi:MAG: hypothetical protein JWO80_1336 [Bryobacterales bacterium]|nr:hypothetical protein [Bryobacterales bacterium]